MMKNGEFNKIFFNKKMSLLIFMIALLIMSATESKILSYSNSHGILDMQFGYGKNEVYQLFQSLGVEGRLLYIKYLFVDFVFIISFAFMQKYLSILVMGKIMLANKWKILISLCYLRGIFDVIENIIVLILLFRFPSGSLYLVLISSFATALKFILLGLWLVALLTSFFVRKQIERRKKYE